MANTLTNVLPVLYKAAQIVPSELTGLIGSVDSTFDAKTVAKGDTVKVPIISAGSLGDYTPAMTTTAGSNTTPTTVDLTMSYSKEYTFHLTGEDEQSLQNGGDNAMEFMRQSTEQGIRAIRNDIEAKLGVELKENSSRAYGTAGTAPFGSDIKAVAQMAKILKDNGCPFDGNVSLVMDTNASVNLQNLVTINNQPAGSPAEQILRGGTLTVLNGVALKESANVAVHTIGTGASYQTKAGYAKGIKSIVVKTGTGTIVKGDVVTFQDETGSNKYVTYGGVAAADDTLTLNSPGLINAVLITKNITVGAAYTANMCFHRSACKLVVRAPFIPASPLIQTELITDPTSGLTFSFSRIVGDGMTTYRLNAVYGIRAVQSEFIATLLG